MGTLYSYLVRSSHEKHIRNTDRPGGRPKLLQLEANGSLPREELRLGQRRCQFQTSRRQRLQHHLCRFLHVTVWMYRCLLSVAVVKLNNKKRRDQLRPQRRWQDHSLSRRPWIICRGCHSKRTSG